MKLLPSLVAVKKITSLVPGSNFSEDELHRVAQLILKAGGVINPIVLRRTSLESYEVIDGDFEYYAAVKAREINPRKGEMIGAFITEPENEEVIKEQVKVLRQRASVDDKLQLEQTQSSAGFESRLTNVELGLVNLELRVEKQIDEFNKTWMRARQELVGELKEKQQAPKVTELLEEFNNLSIAELIDKLNRAGIAGRTAINIVQTIQKERKKKNFESLLDVVTRIKGISDKRMARIIDS